MVFVEVKFGAVVARLDIVGVKLVIIGFNWGMEEAELVTKDVKLVMWEG
jgi:hypothetical protein